MNKGSPMHMGMRIVMCVLRAPGCLIGEQALSENVADSTCTLVVRPTENHWSLRLLVVS